MGAYYRAINNGLLYGGFGCLLHALPNGPEGAKIVLSLDGPKPCDDINGLLEVGVGKMLVMKALPRDFGICHIFQYPLRVVPG
jgi:hypothetical protein